MPRLDNSDLAILALVRTFNETKVGPRDLDFDPKDPGATISIDVCADCFYHYFRMDTIQPDHPPYNEMAGDDYRCIMCGEKLEEERDG